MKRGMKFLSLLLVFVMVFSMLPSTNVLLAAELSSYKGVTSFAEGNHKLIIDTSSRGITYTYKDEYVSIKTTDANDPYFTVNLVDTSMSGKIMAIKYKGDINTSISNPWLYPDTTAGGWGPAAGGVISTSKLVCDGVWNLTTYNLSKELMGSSTSSVGTSAQLNATITSMRIGASSVAGKTVDVAYIGFFDSVAQAQEYDDLFCKVYTDVKSGRVDIIPHGLHYVPKTSYDFQEAAVTNGLALIGSKTNINGEFLFNAGTGASKYVVEGSNKYLKLQYDSMQVNKFFNNGCAYLFSADVKPETAAGHFAGFVFNYGYEKDWKDNKFFESNKVDGENSVGKSGVSVNIHPSMIEVCVITFNAASGTLSQIKYTHPLTSYIDTAFHKFKAIDDGRGKMRFALDGEVFAFVTYADPGLLPSSSDAYNERYYRTATIYDANGNLKATTSNAMISYVKSMAIGSRLRAFNIDNIYYGYEGTVDPSLTLNSTTVSETGNLKATINYGDSITSNLWLGIYNDGEECGSGMGKADPMHRINLSGEKTVSLPRLSAGNYYAVIMRDTSPKGSKVYFTVTDVAKSADIYADDVEANIGGTVKVPVVLGNNPGLKNLVVNVKWDPSVLTPVKATNGIVMGNAVFKATKTTYSYELSWNGTANTTATGTIAYIEFKVNSNANLGDNDVMVTVDSATSGSSDITDQFITDSGFVKVKDTALKIDGTTLSISSDITIKYLVKKDIFDAVGFSNPYLEATLGGKTITLNPITSSVGGVACYLFSFNNVAPQMMNDTIFTTLKATKDGVVYSSKTNQYSVATYIYSKLASATDPSFKTLLVDMLNYGASAQIYNGYNVDKLVSANLTTAQKKFGTSDLRALTNVKKAPTVASGDKATWLAMGLYLDNKVAIKGYFDTDLSNVYVKVTDTSDNLLGTVKQDAFSTVTGPAGTPVYAFVFDGLGASQMSKTVKLTVCDSTGKAISGTFEYSIESYVYSSQSGTDAKLVDITEKIIKYGDAAVNYLNTQTSTFNKLTPADVGTNFFAHITVGGKSVAVSGTNVQLASPAASSSQLWKFIRLDNGAYRIVNESNDKALAVSGAGVTDVTNIITETCNDSLSQQWYLYIQETTYAFRPAHCDKMALDVSNADYTSGTNVQLYTYYGEESQRFFIADRTAENISWYVKNDLGAQIGGVYTDYNAAVAKANENSTTGYAVYDQNGAFVYAKHGQKVAKLLTHAKSVADYARVNGWVYGHSTVNPYLDKSYKHVSCDRFIGWLMGNAGYTAHQPSKEGLSLYGNSGANIISLETFLLRYGFTKVTSISSLKAGDIVFVGYTGSFAPAYSNYPRHVFIIASDYNGGYSYRYDAGSNSRIQSVQPTYETVDKSTNQFRFAYRVPK